MQLPHGSLYGSRLDPMKRTRAGTAGGEGQCFFMPWCGSLWRRKVKPGYGNLQWILEFSEAPFRATRPAFPASKTQLIVRHSSLPFVWLSNGRIAPERAALQAGQPQGIDFGIPSSELIRENPPENTWQRRKAPKP